MTEEEKYTLFTWTLIVAFVIDLRYDTMYSIWILGLLWWYGVLLGVLAWVSGFVFWVFNLLESKEETKEDITRKE